MSFIKTFYFEIIWDLTEKLQNGADFLYILQPAFAHVNNLHNHSTVTKTKKLTLVQYS